MGGDSNIPPWRLCTVLGNTKEIDFYQGDAIYYYYSLLFIFILVG